VAGDQQLLGPARAVGRRKRRKGGPAKDGRSDFRTIGCGPAARTGHLDLDVEDTSVDGHLPRREQRRGGSLLGLAGPVEHQRQVLAWNQRDERANVAAVRTLERRRDGASRCRGRQDQRRCKRRLGDEGGDRARAQKTGATRGARSFAVF
jgi:hypothetical protein